MNNVINILCACILLFVASNASALKSSDQINIDITGEIVAPSCNVAVADTVELGQFSRSDLSSPGASSGLITVDINLSGCSDQASLATVTFSGTPYSADPSFSSVIYANDIVEGSQDIGLQLFNLDGKPITNLASGVNYNFPINTEAGTGTFKFASRLYSPHGTPTAGDFKSTVTLGFTYQ
ncbi:fimbrial protein SthD [Buttiauxella sp. A2-C1_F]|uniref:fimbrial protein n=1 Tax=Buttiauxella sp. A2-C1_F TaxID=2904526 RepID=UPI001E28BC67|nr:fimbrial protein [Buttiauxella sp. A2-C1_F]MCE0843993.1 fimbrial protein SthD [Buttiauxella sp. A2-C1_F]